MVVQEYLDRTQTFWLDMFGLYIPPCSASKLNLARLLNFHQSRAYRIRSAKPQRVLSVMAFTSKGLMQVQCA